ncbi:MAG: hypothetical protein U0Q18_36370 [Bryobacteraceae bacterium]
MRYRRLEERSHEGAGRTLDMSSSAIKFTTEVPLARGEKVEVAMNWPVRLSETCWMKLVISGTVLSSSSACAVVKIVHYEFRTRAATPGVFASRLPQQVHAPDTFRTTLQ